MLMKKLPSTHYSLNKCEIEILRLQGLQCNHRIVDSKKIALCNCQLNLRPPINYKQFKSFMIIFLYLLD